MSDTVIQVENLWKQYRLGVINHHTLTRDLQSWWAMVRGKEDPNLPVGSNILKRTDDERFWALKDISFEVKTGEVLGIIGRNGAGKSTLLKILSQVTLPTKGEVRFNGRIASLLEVGTGFHPELTGRENIYLNGAILGMSRAEIRIKFDDIVAFAEVEKFLDTPVKRYSSGMYVRLAFAVAAHLEPEVLVVDEVLAVGDAMFQKKCLGKIGDVSRQGVTVLLVSHDMRAIYNMCSRTILLSAGMVFRDGASEKIVQEYLELDRKQVAEVDLELCPRKEGLGDRVRLSKAILHDVSGMQSTTFLFGEPFKISVEAVSNIDIEGLSILIGIDSFAGDRLITTSTEDSDIYFNLAANEHLRVSGLYDDVVLAPGIYWVTLGIRCGNSGLDQVVKGFSFEVLSAPAAGRKTHSGAWGFIQVLPRWEKIR